MGEQPVPVEDELERALVSMRAGFVSGSDQITAGIASLEGHLAEAPPEERESVRASVAQIVNTQARLKAKMENLPAVRWDCFKAMVSVVKAQQTVLDQLGHLVKEHVLPRQLENLSAPPPPAFSPAPAPSHAPAPQGESLLRARSALQALDARRVRDARQARDDYPAEDDEPRSLLAWARKWTAGSRGLAAMVVAALILGLLPRDIKLQDFAAKLVAMVGAGVESAPSGGPSATAEEPELAPVLPPTAAAPQVVERVPPLPEVAAVPNRPGPAATKPFDQRRVTGPAPALPDGAAVTGQPAPPALVQPGEKRVAARALIDEPTRAPASVPEEQFVPVVFTHKDYAMVMQAMADLKQRYPNLLIGRIGEVQPVDLGKKGIWHRLVFLPAGPRPQASRLCDQLMAEGYDRCWVKEY